MTMEESHVTQAMSCDMGVKSCDTSRAPPTILLLPAPVDSTDHSCAGEGTSSRQLLTPPATLNCYTVLEKEIQNIINSILALP